MKKLLLLLLCCCAGSIYNNIRAQTWQHYQVPDDPGGEYLGQSLIDNHGNYWVLTGNGGVSKFDGLQWTNYNSGNSVLPGLPLTCLTQDPSGNIWLGSAGAGAFKFDGSSWTNYTMANSGIADNSIRAITSDANGLMWFAGTMNGLCKFNGTAWTAYTPQNSNIGSRYILAMASDAQGNLWLGTADNGLVKYTGVTWTAYNMSNSSISSDFINVILIDASGNKWLSGNNGLLRFDGQHWNQYTETNSPLISPDITSLAEDKQGYIWVGTHGGVNVFNGSKWATFVYGSGLASNKVVSVGIDASDNKWFTTSDNGISELLAGNIAFRSSRNWYIKENSNGSGSSWADAMGSLETVLYDANAGDSIFVAAGTFQPSLNTGFVMKPGVKIFGGFSGTESAFSQRDLQANHVSILKGNGSSVVANSNNGLSVSAILDGFTITGGTGIQDNNTSRGGGICNINVSPSITNCTFKDNVAATGGAMYNQQTSLYVTKCIFTHNSVNSFYNGGAVTDAESYNTYANCIFSDNQSGSTDGQAGAGGAMSLSGSSESFYNCLFYNNRALGSQDAGGGALSIEQSGAYINNCTFYGNTTTALQDMGQGTGVISNSISVDGYGLPGSYVELINSIVYGPQNHQIFASDPGTIHADHSVLKGFAQDINMDGIITNEDITEFFPNTTDPLFRNVSVNDYRLKPGSPCINTGILSYSTQTDLAGNPRTTNNQIDVGAYQNPGLTFTVTPGQSISSNAEDTTADGCIYLYNNNLNSIICGVNPNGQNLGNITATGTLNNQYGSGQSLALSNPFGLSGNFYCLNRAWHVSVSNPLFNQPVTVRYFIDTSDVKDLLSQLPANTKIPHSLDEWKTFAPLVHLYKVAGDNAYDPQASNYQQYTYSEDNQTADTHHFIIGQFQQLFYLEFMVTGFSSGALAYSPAATPVTLLKFEGEIAHSTASLSWRTGEEINFHQFELQKSTDGKDYLTIYTVPAKGNNSNYLQTAPQPEAVAFYRLKLVDKNGQAAFSQVLRLKQENIQLSIFPNPAKDYIMVTAKRSGLIQIYDPSGKQILSVRGHAGENKVEIDQLAPGVYFMKLNEQKSRFIKR